MESESSPMNRLLSDFQALAGAAAERRGGEQRNKVLQPLCKLMDFLSYQASQSFKDSVVNLYHKLLQKGAARASLVWSLEHTYPTAEKLLELIHEADNEVLLYDGFWMVKNFRHFFWQNQHANLAHLLLKSANCIVHLDKHKFGEQSATYVSKDDAKNEFKCSLGEFITHTMGLDMVIKNALHAWIGGGAAEDVFLEALFSSIPARFSIFYDGDVDITRDEQVHLLYGFDDCASLIDASMEGIRRKTIDLNDGTGKCVDIFDVRPSRGEFSKILERGDSRVATSIALADEGFGKCVKKYCQGEKKAKLEVIDGVNKGAIIGSMFGSRTSIHVEDGMLGTYNLLLIGAPKIWYMVPKKNGIKFRRYLVKKNLLGAVLAKTCFVHAFANGTRVPGKTIREFGIRRFVQYPGIAVMSVPGEIYHWTISCGFSLAESGNYFSTAGNDGLGSLRNDWLGFQLEAGDEGNDVAASVTSNTFYEMCNKFDLL